MGDDETDRNREPGEVLHLGLDRYGLTELTERRGSKWSRVGPGAIAAWVADMDYPVAPAVRETLVRAASADDLGYPSRETKRAVREAFARRLSVRYGLLTEPADVVLASDVVQLLYAGVETLTEPGDGVLFLTPTYPPFFSCVSETGRRAVTIDLDAAGGGSQLDLEALDALVRKARPRCLLLCNPHNPTGRVLRRDELEALAGLACEHDLVVLSDEIHADLTLEGAVHVPIAALGPEIARRTVTVTSASKAFNIAGLHCAVAAFGSAELRSRFERIPARLRGGVSSLGMFAALAALSDGGPWLEAVLAELAANRRVVADWAAKIPGVAHHPPEATYLAWLDLRGCGLGDEPARVLEAKAKVVLSEGSTFGPAGAGHVRLNFATPRPVLDELLVRLGSVLGA